MSFIAPEHVFLALVALDEGEAGSVMAAMGLDARALAAEAVRRLRGEAEGEGARAPAGARAGVGAPARRSGGGGGGDGPKALDEFCADLCAAAAAGRVDPVIGRGAEVKRVAQVRRHLYCYDFSCFSC
jgi:ATP-dependent Clp protease ATP-binding subunit ClpC